jgi:hypothetical protein
MGGMQVLEWAATYPDAVFAACRSPDRGASLGAEHRLQRGRAAGDLRRPGLAGRPLLARRHGAGARPRGGADDGAHHLSVGGGADAKIRPAAAPGTRARRHLFGDMFEVESYLRHQGSTFVRRFDANSYLTITRAMDYFDLAADHDGRSGAAFAGTRTRFLLVSFTSDWLFPTAQSRAIARALNRAGGQRQFRRDRESDKGHDAFLLDEPDFHRTLAGFLAGCAEHAGLAVNYGNRRRPPAPAGSGPLRRQEHAARSAADRRDDRARHARAGYRLRRRHADRASVPHPRLRRARHRDRHGGGDPRGRARPAGDAWRCRHRSCALSGRRVRLRGAVAHLAGGGAAARGAAPDAAHRRARGGEFPEFRPLAGALAACCVPGGCR